MSNLSKATEYVSHFSAAKVWSIPYIDYFLKDEYIDPDQNNYINDITVTEPNLRYKRKSYNVHLCKLQHPRGAIVKHQGKIVASPELVFLQLANELDIHQLILLGLQMCSHSPGNPSEAATTKRKLTEFLKKTPGFDGHVKAKRAVKYIENGANSIMESIVFMILTLPYKLGGFNLRGACFNHEVVLDVAAKKQLGKKQCYVDIFYPDVNLAIEYDSTEYHDNKNTYGSDVLRSNTIKCLGIDVLHLTKNQLYMKNACEQLARYIALRLGKRLRNKTKEFYKSNIKLRKLLPH